MTNQTVKDDADVFALADLKVDFQSKRVSRSGVDIALTPKEFSLLSLLAKRRGEVLSRAVIADKIWNTDFENQTNVVEVHIARLRAKIDGPFERRLISTIRGTGYVLNDAL